MSLKPIFVVGLIVSTLSSAYAQTSAFSNPKSSIKQPNQVLVSLPNQYDASDIIRVEINDQSYLSVYYRNKTTGRDDSVWCAEYTSSGLVKIHNAYKPVTAPLCDAGIAAFLKASQ